MILTPAVIAALAFYWLYWASSVAAGVFIALSVHAYRKARTQGKKGR